jgi:hypothetical protein
MDGRDESQIYRDLIRFKPDSLTANAWAVKAGVSRAVWADMRRHGNPSRRTLEKLLSAIGSSLAEFEALRVGHDRAPRMIAAGRLGDAGAQPWEPAHLPPLALVRTALAGEWNEAGSAIDLMEVWSGAFVERLPRPTSLAGDTQAYAVTIVGEGMWPRFRPGRRVAVSPCSPVAVGDDVLVRLTPSPDSRERSGGSEPALVGELVSRTNDYARLRQFKPDREFQVDAAEIEAIHRIAGELF